MTENSWTAKHLRKILEKLKTKFENFIEKKCI